MTECVDEQQTCHHRGRWYGFGPVRDLERVLFAVFPNTDRNGSSLTSNSFTKNLNNKSQSLGRTWFLTRRIFDQDIAHGASATVTTAQVSAIRALRADIRTSPNFRNVRAICVIDQVERGDCDAHATMGYSEAIGPGLSQKDLGILRAKIRLDLANTFAEISPPENHKWPPQWRVLVGRLASIFRATTAVSRVQVISSAR